eukprot:gb/GECG01000791.1/.p1 GENE.gb/GECG01000791.1/~~gb/GECG01000791.1/.p1  ORF type:complete len:256 (+),score=40.94 gb/GECG01000791.1/:1-768(+)
MASIGEEEAGLTPGEDDDEEVHKNEEKEERQPLLPHELVIPFKIALGGDLRALITASFLSHLLYARSQCPMLLRQSSLKSVEEDRKTPQYRKKIQLMRSYQSVVQQLPALFENDVAHVVFILGPNPMNPREIYDLNFCTKCPYLNEDTPASRERAVEKKLSRMLLQPSEEHDWFDAPPRPTKCWILVYMQNNAPEGFTWKRSFRVRKPVGKRKQRNTLSISIKDENVEAAYEPGSRSAFEYQWWQWKSPFVGVKE